MILDKSKTFSNGFSDRSYWISKVGGDGECEKKGKIRDEKPAAEAEEEEKEKFLFCPLS